MPPGLGGLEVDCSQLKPHHHRGEHEREGRGKKEGGRGRRRADTHRGGEGGRRKRGRIGLLLVVLLLLQIQPIDCMEGWKGPAAAAVTLLTP